MLKIETVNIADIKPFERNAKEHPKEQIEQIKKSITEFGMNDPIALDENNVIIEGHGRLLALKELRHETVPCIRLTHMSDEQKRAYILAHNKLTMNTGFDAGMLALEFADLKDLGFDLDLTGFDGKEIDKLLSADTPDVKDDGFDLSAALEEAAFVLQGDVWTLGRHRLMCGDSTKPEDVARLMDGKLANLLLTDPPYGVSYQGKAGKIANDSLTEDTLVEKLLLPAFKNAEAVMENQASAYIFHADTQGEWFRRAFREAGFKLSGVCQWVKPSLVLGRSPYNWRHEPVLFGWKAKGKHKWMSGRDQTTVWEYDKPKKNDIHPTMKPLDLLAKPIKNSTAANEVVLDLFSGSFSTGMACGQLGRVCYAMEFDPKYASASIRRYIETYGVDGVSVERDGVVTGYAEVANG